MKRTNLVLNEHLLQEAVAATGAKTYSEAVNFALEEVIRLKKVHLLKDFHGTGIWEGDLNEMRADSAGSRKKKSRR